VSESTESVCANAWPAAINVSDNDIKHVVNTLVLFFVIVFLPGLLMLYAKSSQQAYLRSRAWRSAFLALGKMSKVMIT
jgi:hypothetical protein